MNKKKLTPAIALVLFAVVFGVMMLRMMSGYDDVATAFVLDVEGGQIDQAYARTSTKLRADVPLEDFRKAVSGRDGRDVFKEASRVSFIRLTSSSGITHGFGRLVTPKADINTEFEFEEENGKVAIDGVWVEHRKIVGLR
jgi:hypothetical protein